MTANDVKGLNHINGQWVAALSGQTRPNTSPANPAHLVGHFPESGPEDVNAAVAAAKAAYPGWKNTPAPKRAELLYKLAELVKQRKEAWALAMSLEMGKTLTEARGDVQEAIDMALHVAGEGRRLFGFTTPSELNNKFAMALRTSIGVCGLITPWNFPIAVPSWKLLPCLLCGNTVVWKPAEDTPHTAELFMQAFIDVGFPPGVINLVQGTGPSAGAPLLENPDVRLISFTGSTQTGRLINEVAGRNLKRTALELGGKNAAIVLADADLDLAIDGLVWGAFGTSGQRCTATSRIIVERPLHAELVKRIIEKAKTLLLGNPALPETQVGPVINQKAVDKILSYIEIGKAEGATLALGGKKAVNAATGEGYYIEPTIFDNVTPTMRIAREEIFGPVVSILPVDSLEEALEVANSVDYGLSSAIYTRDVSKAFKAMNELEAGITYINAPTIGAEVHLPFGGVKNTGNGHREAAHTALDIFSEWKTVYIDYSGHLQRAQIDNAD